MKRHNGRIIAVQVLFSMDFNQYAKEQLNDVFADIQALEEEDEYSVEIDFEFAKKLAEGVMANLSTIDELIINNLVNYSLKRLSYVDRSLIRLATFEMKYTDTPKQIILNEALEITKEYSSLDESQVKFNNKVLDNLAKVIYGE
jgi:N utilization substance protein B